MASCSPKMTRWLREHRPPPSLRLHAQGQSSWSKAGRCSEVWTRAERRQDEAKEGQAEVRAVPDQIRGNPAVIATFENNCIPEPNTGCWLWLGSLFWDGYGQFNVCVGGRWKKLRAHRASLLIYGPSPESQSLYALHQCDTPSCVNPDHLIWGTQAQNIRDMDARDRRGETGHQGEANHKAKLTATDVLAIRSDIRRNSVIAKSYGVNWCTVRDIKTRRSWRHL